MRPTTLAIPETDVALADGVDQAARGRRRAPHEEPTPAEANRGSTHLDAISALFHSDQTAAAAGRDLSAELHLDQDLVLLDHVSPLAPEHLGETVLVAYVPDEQRAHAREVIGTHQGRHVPLDWVQGATDMVDPDTMP